MQKSENSESEFRFLKDNRKYLRQKVTRRHGQIIDSLDNLDEGQCRDEILNFKTLQGKLNNLNDAISELIWAHVKERQHLDEELDTIEKYDEAFNFVISRLEQKLNSFTNLDASFRSVASPNSGSVNHGNLRLPQIPLPEYSHGEGESLALFISNFESIVSKYNLSEYEKFILLEQQLRNEPLKLIKSLQGARKSYTEAKTLLNKAFASDVIQQFNIISKMSQLSLIDGEEPYSFISDCNIIYDTIANLNINIDTVLLYFIWTAMPESMRSQFVVITNKSRPSRREIFDHFFEAAERYNNISVRKAVPKQSYTGLAANIQCDLPKTKPKLNFRPCILCNPADDPHPIFKCPKYPDSSSKVGKLKQLGYCIRCAGPTHRTGECKFKFRQKCSNCRNGEHFNFLCLTRNSNFNMKNRSEVNSSTVVVDCKALSQSKVSETILPTFSCSIGNGRTIRALKDSGCQCNFINCDIAEQEQLPIVRKIKISVNGFNAVKNYDTNIVSVPLMIADKIHEVHAIAIPSINIDLKLHNLPEIIGTFLDRNYVLADKFLSKSSSNISDLDFILGMTSNYCLPEQTIVFGNNNQCTYTESPLGIMIMGDICNLSNNVKYLPRANAKDVECQTVFVDDLSSDVMIDKSISTQTSDRHSILAHEYLPFSEVVWANKCVIDCDGSLLEDKLHAVTNEAVKKFDNNELMKQMDEIMNYDDINSGIHSDHDIEITERTLVNIKIDSDGRLIVPLLWDDKVTKNLGKNFGLSKQILFCNLKKLQKDSSKLLMYDNLINEQIDSRIIEQVSDVESYAKDPNVKFIPHMAVWKLNRATTKIRIVFLSNLVENAGMNISHNQAILPGPTLNRKISTSLIKLRFGRYLLSLDIIKAFHQLSLFSDDQRKLSFLWFKNVREGDFRMVAYKHLRLMFGLRCSPSLLMIALFYILMIDNKNDEQELVSLKRTLYDLAYMDNLSVTCDDKISLEYSITKVETIFSKYKIGLQQYICNDDDMKQSHPEKFSVNEGVVKLLGIQWDTSSDVFFTDTISLNRDASTKRKILQSIASNYDVFNYNAPLLNRSKLFLHELQTKFKLTWDEEIPQTMMNEWINICNQITDIPSLKVKRFVGSKTDEYTLCIFTDSSRVLYGCVLYIINECTNECNFLLSKNRVVSKSLESKSIPCLELTALTLGVEIILDIYSELTGPLSVDPIKINDLIVCSDSLCAINWVMSLNKLEKLNRHSVFVRNRLNSIKSLCEIHPVLFKFCSGIKNPADTVTRPFSYKMLEKTNYLTGLSIADIENMNCEIYSDVVIPNMSVSSNLAVNIERESCEHLFDINASSSFSKIVNIYRIVFGFIKKLKHRVLENSPPIDGNRSPYSEAIFRDQNVHFPEIHGYFDCTSRTLKGIPNLVTQLNVFKDRDGLLRVKAKMKFWSDTQKYPLLMSKNSYLSKLLINDYHARLNHAGCYVVLSELRKDFYIPHVFSLVKSTLSNCVHCKRFNSRTIRLNQNAYKDYRLNPSDIPFKYSFIDYFGPYFVMSGNEKFKAYVLCITCFWSRAVSLQVCFDMTTGSFLRAFQLHIFRYGIPEKIFSDLGSNLVAAGSYIDNLMKEDTIKSYCSDRGIFAVKWEYYPKGNHKLGGMVESMVKVCKRLIQGAVRNLILQSEDFVFLIAEIEHLANKRPVAFTEALRDGNVKQQIPLAITPEILVTGYDLDSINVIPRSRSNETDPDFSFDPVVKIRETSVKLEKARKCLKDVYWNEFSSKLLSDSVNRNDRFKPTQHVKLKIGDIVLLREDLTKVNNFPLGRIESVVENSIGEITSVKVRKGSTRELVIRHVHSLIPFLTDESSAASSEQVDEVKTTSLPSRRSLRQAAVRAREAIREIAQNCN